MEVTMRLGSSFLPDDDDIMFTGQTWQGVGKGGYVLWQVDVSTVSILTMRQLVQGHSTAEINISSTWVKPYVNNMIIIMTATFLRIVPLVMRKCVI